MLDPYMQYSCAYWKDADTLEAAQQAKLKLICEKLQLQPGMRVLDIGCGWGGLSQYMATHYGVSVVGVTISAEQQKWRRRVAKVWMSPFSWKIIAILTISLTESSPSVCSNMSGQKLQHLF